MELVKGAGLGRCCRVEKETALLLCHLLVEGGKGTGFCRGIRVKAFVGRVLDALQNVDRGEQENQGSGLVLLGGCLPYQAAEASHPCSDGGGVRLIIPLAVICPQGKDGQVRKAAIFQNAGQRLDAAAARAVGSSQMVVRPQKPSSITSY